MRTADKKIRELLREIEDCVDLGLSHAEWLLRQFLLGIEARGGDDA